MLESKPDQGLPEDDLVVNPLTDPTRSSTSDWRHSHVESPHDKPWVEKLWDSILLDISFVKRDVEHNRRVWAISAFAVALCVITIAVLYTATSNLGVIFLQTIEEKLGESDIILLPKKKPYLNFTEICK